MSADLWSFIWRSKSLYIPGGHFQGHLGVSIKVCVVSVSDLQFWRFSLDPVSRWLSVSVVGSCFSCVFLRTGCFVSRRESAMYIWESLNSITSVQHNLCPFWVRKGVPYPTLGAKISRRTVFYCKVYLLEVFLSIAYFIHFRLLMVECDIKYLP